MFFQYYSKYCKLFRRLCKSRYDSKNHQSLATLEKKCHTLRRFCMKTSEKSTTFCSKEYNFLRIIGARLVAKIFFHRKHYEENRKIIFSRKNNYYYTKFYLSTVMPKKSKKSINVYCNHLIVGLSK